MASLTTTCVEDCETHFLVKLVDTKTRKDRSFIILPGELENLNLLEIIRKYIQLRPAAISHNRFFINYIREKCTVQPVGVHKIAGVPSVVAKYLNLDNPSSYTGHCFRRTSASLLANSGASMEHIMRHGGWRSSSVAEGYIEESENTKISVASKILGKECSALNPSSSSMHIQDSSVENSSSSGVNIYGNKKCVINIHYHNN